MSNPNQLSASTEEVPATVITESKRTPGFVTIRTPKGRSIGMGKDALTDYGTQTEEIGAALDHEADEDAAWEAENARLDALEPDDEDDGAAYINGHRMDDDNEDPLAGQVDSAIANYEEPQHPWDAHRNEVARQHGH